MTDKMTIAITGGHLTPALAVIDELGQGKWKMVYFGREYATEGDSTPSVERSAVESKGVSFIPLKAGRLQRRFTRYTIPAILRVPIGFVQALVTLIEIKPVIILSFGGYVSVPVVVAGWLLRIPIITHEQTLVQGLANRIDSIFATKIAVSWPQTQNSFPKDKTVLTGNPLRKGVFAVSEKYWTSLNFSENLPLVFITGGNQGSNAINRIVADQLPSLLVKTNVFQQCGQSESFNDFELLSNLKEKLPAKLKSRYHVKKYLNEEEMGTLLNKATLVVGRSGANTVSELAALGKVALLIPLPWNYRDEQTKNATMLEKVGSAKVLKQDGLNGDILRSEIFTMLENIEKYKLQAKVASSLIIPDAAKRIVKLIEETAHDQKT